METQTLSLKKDWIAGFSGDCAVDCDEIEFFFGKFSCAVKSFLVEM